MILISIYSQIKRFFLLERFVVLFFLLRYRSIQLSSILFKRKRYFKNKSYIIMNFVETLSIFLLNVSDFCRIVDVSLVMCEQLIADFPFLLERHTWICKKTFLINKCQIERDKIREIKGIFE